MCGITTAPRVATDCWYPHGCRLGTAHLVRFRVRGRGRVRVRVRVRVRGRVRVRARIRGLGD